MPNFMTSWFVPSNPIVFETEFNKIIEDTRENGQDFVIRLNKISDAEFIKMYGIERDDDKVKDRKIMLRPSYLYNIVSDAEGPILHKGKYITIGDYLDDMSSKDKSIRGYYVTNGSVDTEPYVEMGIMGAGIDPSTSDMMIERKLDELSDNGLINDSNYHLTYRVHF